MYIYIYIYIYINIYIYICIIMSIASVAENVTLHQVTVEEGFSAQFQCDSNAIPSILLLQILFQKHKSSNSHSRHSGRVSVGSICYKCI